VPRYTRRARRGDAKRGRKTPRKLSGSIPTSSFVYFRQNASPDTWHLLSHLRAHTYAMSWIWEKSSTWRWIVRGTRGNPLAMSVFTATTMFAVPIGLGTLVMNGTNPELDAAKIEKLRRDAGLDTKIMVRFPGGPLERRRRLSRSSNPVCLPRERFPQLLASPAPLPSHRR